jgi:hypothetical protein
VPTPDEVADLNCPGRNSVACAAHESSHDSARVRPDGSGSGCGYGIVASLGELRDWNGLGLRLAKRGCKPRYRGVKDRR